MQPAVTTVIEQTILSFCRDFLSSPYLCYTEHGMHALFYTQLYNALPPEARYISWQDQQVCVLQKEYPTADPLGKPHSQPVLDQLRSSLHRFNAVRGTIITTGRFSKGVEAAAFEIGAAPITLIDGEKLLDLLLKNEIGVNKRQVSYYEFAPEKLVQFETDSVG